MLNCDKLKNAYSAGYMQGLDDAVKAINSIIEEKLTFDSIVDFLEEVIKRM